MEDTRPLVIGNYKEPLKEVPKASGFGYYGAIRMTEDGALMECHVCGKLLEDVGTHARWAHELSGDKYKYTYGLMKTTVLLAEKERTRRKQTAIDLNDSLTPDQKLANMRRAQAAFVKSKGLRKSFPKTRTLEFQNKQGTCPDQLLDKIKKVKEKLGHQPTLQEFVQECGTQRYKHLIFKVFGSWAAALKMLGMLPQAKVPKKGGMRESFSDQMLGDALRIYWEENGQVPTYTDFNREVLPEYGLYIRRFGSIREARRVAGIPLKPVANAKRI